MRLENQLYVGDAKELLLKVPDNSIDLIVTSPPYAKKREDAFGHKMPVDDYFDWLYSISELAMKKIKPTGSFVLNIKEHVNKGKRDPKILEYLLKMAKREWWTETYIWAKTNPYPTGNTRRLKDGFEYCYHFTKGEYKFFPENCLVPSNPKWVKDNERRKDKGQHNVNNGSGLNMATRTCSPMARPSNVITLSTNTTNTKHPATFPVGLPSFFIKLMTAPGDVVLDTFIGSGKTAIACVNEGRKYLGFDLKQEYVDMARKAIEEI